MELAQQRMERAGLLQQFIDLQATDSAKEKKPEGLMSFESLNLESILMRAAAYMAASKNNEDDEYEDIVETEEITPEKL